MGMFDSLWVKCPQCSKEIEFQSKAGECYLHNYNLDDVPAGVAGDLIGESAICSGCGRTVTIRGKTFLCIE